jgi:uncharacterized repeat protein (TIGR01451 family)
MTELYLPLKRFAAALQVFYLLGLSAANAAPTVAGTIISNQAQLRYSVNSIAQAPLPSNIISFTVQEMVDVSLSWQDAGALRVNTPQSTSALSFVLSNTGNGTKAFSIARNNAITGDQFDPINAAVGAVFIENGLQPGFQATGPFADTVYVTGVTEPVLAPGESVILYAVSDIPSGLSIGNLGQIELSVRATTVGLAGSIPGSTHANVSSPALVSDDRTQTVVTGTSTGVSSARASYLIDGVEVRVIKTVMSPSNPSLFIPGVEIRYQLLVKVQGIGSVQQLIITDPLPEQLLYVANSIQVNSQSKTDAIDSDNSQFVGNTLTVNLGNVTAPTDFIIEFKTTLK